MLNTKISNTEESFLDIIIINYNSTQYSLRCIESIKQNIDLHEARIIVVDNNSYDEPDRITDRYPGVNLIKNYKNIGFGNAINIALKITKAKFIILLNPDALIVDSSFYKIFEFLNDNKEIAVAGPKILDGDGSLQGSARRFPSIWTSMFGRKSPLTKFFPNNPITKREIICFNGKKDIPQTVDWVSGACMVIRSEAIKQVGGFDSGFFMYWEDADLCKRLKDRGWKIIYYPQSQVYHHIGKSSNTRPIRSIFHFHNSCYYYFRKHAKWPTILLTPVAFIGLALRCVFVMGLNILQQLLNMVKNLSKKMRLRNKNTDTDCNKLKILRIVSRLNIGGPSIHCSILTKGLHQSQFESKLVSGKTSPHEGDMSYLVNTDENLLIHVPELQREISFTKDIRALFKITQIVFKEKPDIVDTHMAKAGAISRVAVFIHNLISTKKVKTVHTFHGNVLDGYFNPQKSNIFLRIEKALAKITDVIIAISQTQKWEITKKYNIAGDDKVHIINLGFDLSRFTNGNKKGDLRSTLGIGERTILIGIVGRLVPIKNHTLFLDSAKLILQRFPEKKILFLIVGDGELRAHLEAYARKIGIHGNVVFYGWKKSIEKIYSDLDILLLTSNNEGTPVSIIESMASSVPVVTTGVGGVKDLLGRIINNAPEDRQCTICERGILCPKGDAHAIVDGVQYLMENDNSALINGARDFVCQNYTDIVLIQRIEHLYKNLVHCRP